MSKDTAALFETMNNLKAQMNPRTTSSPWRYDYFLASASVLGISGLSVPLGDPAVVAAAIIVLLVLLNSLFVSRRLIHLREEQAAADTKSEESDSATLVRPAIPPSARPQSNYASRILNRGTDR